MNQGITACIVVHPVLSIAFRQQYPYTSLIVFPLRSAFQYWIHLHHSLRRASFKLMIVWKNRTMEEPKLQTKTVASKHGKMGVNADTDRLSSLPDELIHKILSFVNMREAIGTSALSSRWRFVWTSMPHLNFSSEGFSSLPKFSKFIRHVMSRLKARNNLTKVYSVKLSFCGKATPSQMSLYVKIILGYVLSHNIQQLDVVVNGIKLPLPRLSSPSLKHLSLTKQTDRGYGSYLVDGSLTSTLELPMLTTLDLHSVTFCDDGADKCIDAFSKFVNLTDLTLNEFEAKESNGFNISHPQLTNLTLKNIRSNVKVVNVVAPHLKNLTIIDCRAKLVISAPNLATLICKNYFALHLSTDGFASLESAHVCFQQQHYRGNANAQELVCLLQQLRSVKFLTLSLEIVELLSSSVRLLLPQPSPFVNLKILNIYPRVHLLEDAPKRVTMTTELKSYLLGGSSGAILTMVLREEIIAHKCMDELELLLEEEKDTTKTSGAHLDPWKRQQIHIPESKKLNVGDGSTAQTKSCREKLGVLIEKAGRLNSKLQGIEELLIKLPESHIAKLQPRFSSLSTEADIAISQIIDCVKIQCDVNRSRSSDSFHDLAPTLGPSS